MLHKGKSKFQTVEVVKTKPFGSLLVTDGLMQSSEDDEYVYHQSLVHPVMTAHPNPQEGFLSPAEERCVFIRIRSTPRALRSFSPPGSCGMMRCYEDP